MNAEAKMYPKLKKLGNKMYSLSSLCSFLAFFFLFNKLFLGAGVIPYTVICGKLISGMKNKNLGVWVECGRRILLFCERKGN